MSDVADRIAARLDELEAAAMAAAESRGSDADHWTAVEDGDGWAIEAAPDLCVSCNDSGGNELTAEVAAHIALNDPAAVLRMVAGLRAVVARCGLVLASWDAMHGGDPRMAMWPDVNRRERSHANATLDLIAAMFPEAPAEGRP